MSKPLRLLLIEESPGDADRVLGELRRAGFDPAVARVGTAAALEEALERQTWDVIIAEPNAPQFSARDAAGLVRQKGLDVPVILVAAPGEGPADAPGLGPADGLSRECLGDLGRAVEQALDRKRLREAAGPPDRLVPDSELRFRAMVENSSDAIVLLSADGVIQYTSPAIARILDYRPDEVVGRELADLIDPEDQAGVRAEFARLQKMPGERIDIPEFRGRARDGSLRWLEGVASNFLDEPGIRAVLAHFRDVTRHKEAERHENEMRLARQIQRKLFPARMPEFPGLDFGGLSHPAEATGGDYFDFIPMPDGSLGVVVGDVSGHGFGPALLMASIRAYVRAFAGTRTDVSEILGLANRALCYDTRTDQFATVLFARFEPRTRSFVYASAGHPTCYVLDPAGEVKTGLDSTGIPMGIDPDQDYPASGLMTLEPGELVVLLTDGILEARAPDNIPFGTDRLLSIARAYRHDSAAQIAENLYYAVRAFAQDTAQVDDITAVIIKVGQTP